MERAIGVILNEDGSAADLNSLVPARQEIKSTKYRKGTKRKKCVGLYVGMVLSIFIAVGCSVAATLLFIKVANS